MRPKEAQSEMAPESKCERSADRRSKAKVERESAVDGRDGSRPPGTHEVPVTSRVFVFVRVDHSQFDKRRKATRRQFGGNLPCDSVASSLLEKPRRDKRRETAPRG